jgi:dethiobiotin synthetase
MTITTDKLHPRLHQSLFVAGTDTGVGKTWVSVRLLRALGGAGYRVAGMKPVAAGAEATPEGLRNDDALALLAAGNVALPYELANPCCLARPTSPHLAAAEAGVEINIESIRQAYASIMLQSELIIVEGAGGWLAPIGPLGDAGQPGPTMQDVALVLGLPVVLVVGLRLGCLSHALLTAEAVRRSGLELLGWVANTLDPHFVDRDLYIESLVQRLPEPLLLGFPSSGAAG